jgi:KEOPS complex subunit Cgi121
MEVVEGTARIDDVEAFLGKLDAVADEHGVTIQAFDARYVVGREHLERAVELATRAIDRGEAIAREEGVEILLYAAGRRQINRALEMGVAEGEWPVVAVVVDTDRESPGGDPADDESSAGDSTDRERAAAADLREHLDPAETLGKYDEPRVCEFFGVTDREREATAGDLADLVCERVALLVVER